MSEDGGGDKSGKMEPARKKTFKNAPVQKHPPIKTIFCSFLWKTCHIEQKESFWNHVLGNFFLWKKLMFKARELLTFPSSNSQCLKRCQPPAIMTVENLSVSYQCCFSRFKSVISLGIKSVNKEMRNVR